MNTRNTLIILSACLLLIAVPSQATDAGDTTQDCAVVSISNHGEVNVDPDGCLWSKIDRLVNGADGTDGEDDGTPS